MITALDVFKQVEAVCPAIGVSIGKIDDKKTWRVDYLPEATAEHKAAASEAIEKFDASRASPPASISDRQFFQQLAVNGIISQEQALASNAAVIPDPLLAIVEQMPEDQRFGVKMLVSGATTFERDNPVTLAIGQAYGMTSEQIDQFFIEAASL